MCLCVCVYTQSVSNYALWGFILKLCSVHCANFRDDKVSVGYTKNLLIEFQN